MIGLAAGPRQQGLMVACSYPVSEVCSAQQHDRQVDGDGPAARLPGSRDSTAATAAEGLDANSRAARRTFRRPCARYAAGFVFMHPSSEDAVTSLDLGVVAVTWADSLK